MLLLVAGLGKMLQTGNLDVSVLSRCVQHTENGSYHVIYGHMVGIEDQVVVTKVIQVLFEMVTDEMPSLLISREHAAAAEFRCNVPVLTEALHSNLLGGNSSDVQTTSFLPKGEVRTPADENCLTLGGKVRQRPEQRLMILIEAERVPLRHSKEAQKGIGNQALRPLIELPHQTLAYVAVICYVIDDLLIEDVPPQTNGQLVSDFISKSAIATTDGNKAKPGPGFLDWFFTFGPATGLPEKHLALNHTFRTHKTAQFGTAHFHLLTPECNY